jgi:hypothetical protein
LHWCRRVVDACGASHWSSRSSAASEPRDASRQAAPPTLCCCGWVRAGGWVQHITALVLRCMCDPNTCCNLPVPACSSSPPAPRLLLRLLLLPLLLPPHLAGGCIVGHKAALGGIALRAAEALGGVLKGQRLQREGVVGEEVARRQQPPQQQHKGFELVAGHVQQCRLGCMQPANLHNALGHSNAAVTIHKPTFQVCLQLPAWPMCTPCPPLHTPPTHPPPHLCIHPAAVHADVGGQLLLPRGQLAAKARGGGLLGQALHVDALVGALHHLKGTARGRWGEGGKVRWQAGRIRSYELWGGCRSP